MNYRYYFCIVVIIHETQPNNNRNTMKKFLLILTTVLAQSASAQIEVNKGKFTWDTSFPIVTCDKESASLLYDQNDFKPVGTAVGMLAEDIKRTTDADMPIINSIPQKAKSLIVAGIRLT